MKIFAVLVLALAWGAAWSEEGSPPKQYPAWDGKESVEEYAKRVGLKTTQTLDLGGDVKLELVLVPPGTFQMGSPDTEVKRKEEEGGEKLHKVTLTAPFYLAKYELTQAQYEKVIGTNPSSTKDDKLPVTDVNWADAVAFCKKASEQLKCDMHLPTEAQWEFAARAGTQTAFYTGNEEEDMNKAGWHGKNSGRKVHPVGEKAPNAFGLYDMLGNVRELCADAFAPYDGKDETDPTGPKDGETHVSRGGAAFAATHLICRCAMRSNEPANRRNGIVGLRPALGIPAAK